MFDNQIQQLAFFRIVLLLSELFPDATLQTSRDEPVALVIHPHESLVIVAIRAWGDDAILCVGACLTVGTEATPELLRYLVESNRTLVFGGLGLDDEGNVIWSDQVRARDASRDDVQTLVQAARAAGHHFGPEITSRFGGVTHAEYAQDVAQSNRTEAS
jgi:hypothetical protein